MYKGSDLDRVPCCCHWVFRKSFKSSLWPAWWAVPCSSQALFFQASFRTLLGDGTNQTQPPHTPGTDLSDKRTSPFCPPCPHAGKPPAKHWSETLSSLLLLSLWTGLDMRDLLSWESSVYNYLKRWYCVIPNVLRVCNMSRSSLIFVLSKMSPKNRGR